MSKGLQGSETSPKLTLTATPPSPVHSDEEISLSDRQSARKEREQSTSTGYVKRKLEKPFIVRNAEGSKEQQEDPSISRYWEGKKWR